MNLQKLVYFVHLAEKEHMTNTAKELNISQPTLSYSIAELEDELGAPLFNRTGRNIELTQYGKIYYKYAKNAIKQLDTGKRLIRDLIDPYHGNINFGFIYTMGAYIAPHLVQAFTQDSMNKEVQFKFSQGSSLQILNQLKTEEIDIALTSKIAGVKGISFEPLAQEALKLVVPLNHPLANKDAIYLAEAEPYPFVYYSQSSGLRPLLDRILAQAKIKAKFAIELIEDHVILGFVNQNFGVAIVPETVSTEGYQVKSLDILDEMEERWIYLAKRESGYQSPALKRFYQFCLEYKE